MSSALPPSCLHLTLPLSVRFAVVVPPLVFRLLADFLANEIHNGCQCLNGAGDQAHPFVGAGIEVVGFGHFDSRSDALLNFCDGLAAFADDAAWLAR
jgi:hypothetical protein